MWWGKWLCKQRVSYVYYSEKFHMDMLRYVYYGFVQEICGEVHGFINWLVSKVYCVVFLFGGKLSALYIILVWGSFHWGLSCLAEKNGHWDFTLVCLKIRNPWLHWLHNSHSRKKCHLVICTIFRHLPSTNSGESKPGGLEHVLFFHMFPYNWF